MSYINFFSSLEIGSATFLVEQPPCEHGCPAHGQDGRAPGLLHNTTPTRL